MAQTQIIIKVEIFKALSLSSLPAVKDMESSHKICFGGSFSRGLSNCVHVHALKYTKVRGA